jgi:NAD+ diphosphatase
MTDTSFTPQIAFSGGDLDHLEDKRDITSLKKYLKDPNARALILNDGKPAIRENGSLLTVHPQDLVGKDIGAPGPIFLGVDKIGPVFAFTLDSAQGLAPEDAFAEMRFIAGRMDARSLAIAGRAKSLFDWHLSHRFCSACGKQSQAIQGGLSRKCPVCETDHFPRVNPVAIMLVINGDDCLLGRSAGWPDGAYSALAGFVSPGETLEEGCAREVKEEVGINVRNTKYLFSQPWPFPGQLMMGIKCETDDTEITVNTHEIEDAKWFSKQTIQDVFDKKSDAFLRPPSFTIACQLLRHWLSE